MVEQRIKETIKKLDSLSRNVHSSSMAFRFGYDYTFLASLVEDMGLSFPLREDLMQMIPDELLENVSLYIDNLDELAKRGIDVFKKIDFYCYLRNGNTSISAKDKSDILREYLLKEMPFAYQLYKDLYNEGHIAFSENDKNYGSAYLMPLIDEYYITLNRCSLNDLSDIETTIHELMHVYIAKLSSSYSWRNHHNIISGFSKESASMYSSLNFYDFCLSNHICLDDALLNRNVSDYETLCRFKLIHYFYEMGVRREKELTISEGIDYKFDEAIKLDEDEGVPFFNTMKMNVVKSRLINFYMQQVLLKAINY